MKDLPDRIANSTLSNWEAMDKRLSVSSERGRESESQGERSNKRESEGESERERESEREGERGRVRSNRREAGRERRMLWHNRPRSYARISNEVCR